MLQNVVAWANKTWTRLTSWLDPGADGKPQGTDPVQSQDEVTTDFYAEVRDASDFLNFLISEGYSRNVQDSIPDRIIEEIEAARDLLRNSSVPSREDRTRLRKAYRDLVNLPRTSVTFTRVRPTSSWSPRSSRLSRLQWIGVAVVAVAALYFIYLLAGFYNTVAIIVAFGLLFWAYDVFTGIVTDSKLNRIIKFCYVFTIGSLIVATVPWLLWPANKGPVEIASPLRVLPGCVSSRLPGTVAPNPTSTPPNSIPSEISCPNIQWVVSLGGVSLASPIIDPSPLPPYYDPPPLPPYHEIFGGVVVPLYVVMLSFFGGAISMTRRVPEYQRRAMDARDTLTNVDARESLVFQIMQVLSAPLIAVTVYYILRPGSLTESVVVGFGSGFASEPILLLIRGLVEKLSPAKSVPPAPPPGQQNSERRQDDVIPGNTLTDPTRALNQITQRIEQSLNIAGIIETVLKPVLPAGLIPDQLAKLISQGKEFLPRAKAAQTSGGISSDFVGQLTSFANTLIGGTGLSGLLGKAAGAIPQMLGIGAGPVGLIMSLGYGLGKEEYQRWRARILAAPWDPAVISPGLFTGTSAQMVLPDCPIFNAAFQTTADQQPGFYVDLLNDALAVDAIDRMWAKYGSNATMFANRDVLQEGIVQFRLALLGNKSAEDISVTDLTDTVAKLNESANPDLRPGNAPSLIDLNKALDLGLATQVVPDDSKAALHGLVLLVEEARKSEIDFPKLLTEIPR